MYNHPPEGGANYLSMDTVSEKNEQPCTIPFGYRFKITSKEKNKVFGTGFFKSSRKLNKEEQIDFMHQYTNGAYFDKKSYMDICVFEADA